jgi:hypothetical protein
MVPRCNFGKIAQAIERIDDGLQRRVAGREALDEPSGDRMVKKL